MSVRYGITPERAKLVIWAQQHFLEEVLPQMTPEMIRLAYEIDSEYEKISPSQDYGLDLQEMEKKFLGEEIEYYPERLIPKNKKIKNEAFRIEELRNKDKSVHVSSMLESSLFGNKLKGKNGKKEQKRN